MSRIVLAVAFLTGLACVVWIGAGFLDSSAIALAMTVLIGLVYLLGAFEVGRFRAASTSLAAALTAPPQPPIALDDWLARLPASLRPAVRARVEGERVALPGLALTPYLVGLLVMLGMLGTFLGMVMTFKGAVFALEGSADLQAVRSALAAPIKGLGLAFGTSVAGVATSAMLGLMSAISRRERAIVTQGLDARIATDFRALSLVHQRQEAFRALQTQASTLPALVDRLQTLIDGVERRTEQLDERLSERQAAFLREASAAYTGLAQSVGSSLQDSLGASARIAGEQVLPVVEAAMGAIARESTRLHEGVGEAVQAQLDGVSARFDALASGTLQRQTQALEAMSATVGEQWQRVGEQTLARQHAACEALETSAARIVERTSEHAGRTLDGVERLLASAEGLTRSRIDSETDWLQRQDERLDRMTALWRTELGALRDEERERGRAAVERLGELQAATATQLAALGGALEAPITRMLAAASEAPRAAAEVIAQLREQMSRIAERDDQALEERTALHERVAVLLQGLERASDGQRAAIESLTASAARVIDDAGARFAALAGEQADAAQRSAAHAAGSAIELASLAEAFGQGVEAFGASSEKVVASLQRLEAALEQSIARSDDQLAYYVAQAREVIDLSITSQQGILEDLRRLHGRQAAEAGAELR